MTRRAALAVLAFLLAQTQAAAQSGSPPSPNQFQDFSRNITNRARQLAGPGDPVDLPANFIRASPGPAPREVSGWVVMRTPDGRLLPRNGRYPNIVVLFQTTRAFDNGRAALRSFELNTSLAPPEDPYGAGFFYRFYLEQSDRTDLYFYGVGGYQSDPGRTNGIIYNPAEMTYIGFKVDIGWSEQDPNTGQPLPIRGFGVPSPNTYTDTVGFTR